MMLPSIRNKLILLNNIVPSDITVGLVSSISENLVIFTISNAIDLCYLQLIKLTEPMSKFPKRF